VSKTIAGTGEKKKGKALRASIRRIREIPNVKKSKCKKIEENKLKECQEREQGESEKTAGAGRYFFLGEQKIFSKFLEIKKNKKSTTRFARFLFFNFP